MTGFFALPFESAAAETAAALISLFKSQYQKDLGAVVAGKPRKRPPGVTP